MNHSTSQFQSLTKVPVIWWSFGPAQWQSLPVQIFFWWTESFFANTMKYIRSRFSTKVAKIVVYRYNRGKPLYFVARRTYNFVVKRLPHKTTSCHLYLRSKFYMVSELKKVRHLHCNLLHLYAGTSKIFIFITSLLKKSHLNDCFSIFELRKALGTRLHIPVQDILMDR